MRNQGGTGAVVLDRSEWYPLRTAHQERVDGWLAPHLERRRTGRAHPVADFLFTYYSYRPAQLRRWHPGAGVVLAGVGPDDSGFGAEYVRDGTGVTLDTATVLARRGESVRWIAELLRRTGERAGFFGCFGLHEWAMVYRQRAEEVRHHAWPLRLGATGTAEVVAGQRIRCSHFDAYRFFTPAARPLNTLRPTREGQLDNEQPACLHANMDLYKWAYKLAPLVASELVADAFALAREIRTLDMRASPYDLEALGYAPVRIETPEGRAEYAQQQRDFATRAALLRERLLAAVEPLVGAAPRAAEGVGTA